MNERYEDLESQLKEIIEKMSDKNLDVSTLVTYYHSGQEIIKKMETCLDELKREVEATSTDQ